MNVVYTIDIIISRDGSNQISRLISAQNGGQEIKHIRENVCWMSNPKPGIGSAEEIYFWNWKQLQKKRLFPPFIMIIFIPYYIYNAGDFFFLLQ